MPAVAILSLMPMGIPCRGPRYSPRISAASCSFACCLACSGRRVINAFKVGCSRSACARAASVTSTGEISLALILGANSAMVRVRSVVSAISVVPLRMPVRDGQIALQRIIAYARSVNRAMEKSNHEGVGLRDKVCTASSRRGQPTSPVDERTGLWYGYAAGEAKYAPREAGVFVLANLLLEEDR